MDPGVRRWLIACDESGVHGATHYGFGSLWMKWQRRGNFADDFRAMAKRHQMTRECKWTNTDSMKYLPFYKELIDYFFARRWMVFQCLVVRKSSVNPEFHGRDWDLARRKHFTMLLTNKMKLALARYPDREHEFRVHVDPIASCYGKADEAVEIISNNVLNQHFPGLAPVTSVRTHHSHESPPIQLCDLLLGAVMETWQQRNTNKARESVRVHIASHLGWETLDADTHKDERKFNIWYFLDTTRQRREIKTREVRLKYPYPGSRDS